MRLRRDKTHYLSATASDGDAANKTEQGTAGDKITNPDNQAR